MSEICLSRCPLRSIFLPNNKNKNNEEVVAEEEEEEEVKKAARLSAQPLRALINFASLLQLFMPYAS
jgi:hypothetical protein